MIYNNIFAFIWGALTALFLNPLFKAQGLNCYSDYRFWIIFIIPIIAVNTKGIIK